MPRSDAASQRSVATQGSNATILRSRDIEDGMVGVAHHSVKHPIVTALSSVVSNIAPGSRLQRDLAGLKKNHGKNRPFIVTRKPRGIGQPPRIVLITHFDYTPIGELDECSQLLAVALGTVTPPHPLPTSPRIQIEPEWTQKNSYTIAYPIDLKSDRHPTRMSTPKGGYHQVNTDELDRLRDLCLERTASLATMPAAALAAIQNSYEAHEPPPSSKRGTQVTQSRVSTLASIAEDEPATPTAAPSQKEGAEADEEGFREVKNSRRRVSVKRGNSRAG